MDRAASSRVIQFPHGVPIAEVAEWLALFERLDPERRRLVLYWARRLDVTPTARRDSAAHPPQWIAPS